MARGHLRRRRRQCRRHAGRWLLTAAAAPAAVEGDLARACPGGLQTICVARPSAAAAVAPASLRPRLGVFVVGQRDRFYPLTTLKHVVSPAAKEGYDVDYHALLSLSSSPGAGAFKADWFRPRANPAMANLSASALIEHLVRRAQYYGARSASLHLLPTDVEVAASPPRRQRHRWLGRDSSANVAVEFALRRWKKMELLWNMTRRHEDAGQRAYDVVVLTRDDIHWVNDVYMPHFSDPWTVYSRSVGVLCARSLYPTGPNDQAIVLGGQIADLFMTLYSQYFHLYDVVELGDAVDSVEDYFIRFARWKGVAWKIVRGEWLQFFMGLHMDVEGSDQPLFCLRGLTRELLEHPEDFCMHPKSVPHALCEELVR
eukprot:TRINITY_DN31454_c0_g1_i1.p1 TRINITY_DN31454_c0_g1~~TRINITY_DN31454_c0_g1_i1.p1  ORF type:complete len:371 (+),score=57.43 TRINITY_DN31454_c0_g1_i1:39-1151(+)